jgi:hypothetical protein
MAIANWLAVNNPVACFHSKRLDPANVDINLELLEEPGLTAVCRQLGLNVYKKKVKGKKEEISKYYYRKHKEAWEKRKAYEVWGRERSVVEELL